MKRADHIICMRLPAPGSAAGSVPSAGPAASPLCQWLFDCNEPAVGAGLCAFHAHVAREEIAEFERGDLEDEL